MLSRVICFLVVSSLLYRQVYAGYFVTSQSSDPNNVYNTLILSYNGNEKNYLKKTNDIIQNLNLTYYFASPSHLVVRVTDASKDRWEIPCEAPFPCVDLSQKPIPYEDGLARVEIDQNPFNFRVIRKETNEIIFNTSPSPLIYSNQLIQLSTELPTPNIYGFGERTFKFNLGPTGTYTLFTKDNPAAVENGTSGNNLYGFHPVYLGREKSNRFSMVLLRTSNAMEATLSEGKTLTYKVLGGILDFNFFLGNPGESTPETVVQQYHNYLGGWTLQPFWSFGFHQSRWGYQSIDNLIEVLENYKQFKLPLDAIWSDIDYMVSYRDFTIDEMRFPADGMKQMLQTYNKRWIPIVDAGIALQDIHNNDGDIFIKDPNGKNLLGTVWPGNVNYPDFFNPNTTEYWKKNLDNLHKEIPFSGIWLDMNEVSNFAAGEVDFYPAPMTH